MRSRSPSRLHGRLLTSACLLLLAVSACSTESTPTPTTGAGGSGQGGASSGTGGTGGAGGSSATGQGGGGGDGGATGTGGATGSGGSGGSGGATGNGGSGGATGNGGSGGATGNGGAGGGGATITISGTDGNFNNSFLVTPCMAAGTGYDCPNRLAGQAACPTAAWQAPMPIGATTEATGTTYSQSYTVSGGEPGRVYAVTARVRGQVEPRVYTGGMRQATVPADPQGTANDLLHIGGRPGTSSVDYNVFMMTILPGTGDTVIPNAPQFYAFNSVTTAHQGAHYNFQVDEMMTFRVKPGFTITLTNHDSNCIAIKNCGRGGPYGFGSAQLCEAQARTIDGVTLPATYRGAALANGGAQPFQTQFLNFQIMNVVAE